MSQIPFIRAWGRGSWLVGAPQESNDIEERMVSMGKVKEILRDVWHGIKEWPYIPLMLLIIWAHYYGAASTGEDIGECLKNIDDDLTILILLCLFVCSYLDRLERLLRSKSRQGGNKEG